VFATTNKVFMACTLSTAAERPALTTWLSLHGFVARSSPIRDPGSEVDPVWFADPVHVRDRAGKDEPQLNPLAVESFGHPTTASPLEDGDRLSAAEGHVALTPSLAS
jgi:hypothetical protein